MKFLVVLVLLIPVITASDEASSKEAHEEGEKEAKALRETVNGNTEFAIRYFKLVTSTSSKDSPPKNVVMSPLSISSAFSMLSLGARSKTHREIWEGLSLNNTHCKEEEIHQAFSNLLQKLNEPKNSLQLHVGNAIFMDDKVKVLKGFTDGAQQNYHADIKQEDFSDKKEVEKKINEYVKEETKGKIEEAVKDISEDTKMVLVNTVYFKGEWENTFHPDSTRAAKFFIDEDTTVDVQMMHRTGLYNTYQDTKLNCMVVELPYRGNASMIIALPEPGKINEVVEGMSAETLHRWRTSSENGYIDLHVPKFVISSSMDLKKDMAALGITTAFTDEADFSGITKDVGLKAGKATHKAVLDMDENGTEASAVTTIEMVPAALFPTVNIDHPFIFTIYDYATNSILFIGDVMNPVQK